MNVGRRDYETRKAARIARLEARATRAHTESAAAFGAARRIGAGIPFGQPILVGHHSERRHRRDAEKITRNMRKGVALAAEAERLERRAARAEANEAVSSDDPEALTKLRAKVAAIETTKERMKQCNSVIRKARNAAKGKGADETRAIIAALCKELGWTEATASKLAQPDCFGNIGFASFELTNRGAEVKRLKQRIAQLEARAAVEPQEMTVGGVRICEADNRVQLCFPSKPSAALRSVLKSNGFRWAPSVGAWQRMLSPAARSAALRIASQSVETFP